MLAYGGSMSAEQRQQFDAVHQPMGARCSQAHGQTWGAWWLIILQKALKLFCGDQWLALDHKMNTFN